MPRQRILALTSRVPYPLIGGDRLRAYHFLRILATRYEVDLVSLNEGAPEAGALEHLRGFLREVRCFPHSALRHKWNALTHGLLRGRPLQVGYYWFPEVRSWIRSRGDAYDLAFCFHVRTVEYASGLSAPTVVDLVDAISLGYRRALEAPVGQLWPRIYGIETPRLLAYEKGTIASSARSFIISPVDRDYLVGEGAPAERIRVIPNGTDLAHDPPDGGTRRKDVEILFLGRMDTQPNQAAALYFARKILPLLGGGGRPPRLHIVGAHPTPRVRSLADGDRIVVTGEVDRPQDWIRSAAVVVAPMISGAGQQNKILEAMALGRPVVTTSLAAGGIGGEPGVHYLVGDDPASFARAVEDLLADPPRREQVGAAGRQLVRERYTWQSVGDRLLAEIADLLADRSPHRPCPAPIGTDRP
jgi:glycosyltransferase involved in cell wall biosynthesis